MPTTLQQLVPMERFVRKQLKGVDGDRNLSIRVITAAFSMQKVYLQARRQRKRNRFQSHVFAKGFALFWDFEPDIWQDHAELFVQQIFLLYRCTSWKKRWKQAAEDNEDSEVKFGANAG